MTVSRIRHVFQTFVAFVRTGWGRLLLVSTIFLIPMLALKLHGPEALVGVTWGHEVWLEKVCEKAERACRSIRRTVPVNIGVYDPAGEFSGLGMAIEHLYLRWNPFDRATFLHDLETARRRDRWPLVTVEPWPDHSRRRARLLEDVSAGRFDDRIDAVCTALREFGSPAFVRWGHEMDYVTGRYPWATPNAAAYVTAYRHFVDRCRTATTDDVYYVWSPVGTKDSRAYWPGREYADYVGVSVYAFPNWDMAHYGKVRTFDEIFEEKYRLMRDLDRPVMVAELGVTGSRDHQIAWMHEAFRSFSRYPLLKSVVYFHAIDSPEAWPAEYGRPDWRMDLRAVTVRFASR